MSNTQRVNVPGVVFVPHTHWDREWYEPFQVFRHRLVSALDIVLEMMDAEPNFRFTLDGQTQAIADYLEIRPENRQRVRAAVERGQLSIGPWLILLDEFLCTGETIVRNLQLGTRDAEALGGAMRVGYLPDMFGHVAQMPQILTRAGLEHTALWRGAPGAVSGHAFRWAAPDGSTVRAEYLFDGYGNGLDVLLVPDRIPAALREYAAATAERWGNDPILGMVGTDHMPPHQQLMDWVRRDNDPAFPIHVASLEEYVTQHVDDARLTDVVGELRSHARGNILPGVLSIRRPLKRAMALAERTVDEAERLAATFRTDDSSPFLEIAWRKVIESTAHDSVVGSGTDETVEQVQARLGEAAQIGRAVRDRVLGSVASTVGSDAYVVVNPLTRSRQTLVEVEYAGPDASDPLVAITAEGVLLPVQRLHSSPEILADERMDAADVERVLRRIHRRELFGQQIDRYEITPGSLVFRVAEVPLATEFDLMSLRSELAAAIRETPGEWRIRTLAAPRVSALVAPEVPASGAIALRLVADPAAESTAVSTAAVRATTTGLANELVAVTITPDGTLDVTGQDGTVLRGVGRLVDGGDRGDTYNYGPPAHDLVIDRPVAVRVDLIEAGPIRGVVDIVRSYDIPASLTDDPDTRSSDTVLTDITTRVELHAGEPYVRLTVTWVNGSRDHRVRLHIPLPERVDRSASEGQFAVTERGLTGEGGWGEYPIPTYPATSFASAGAATVLLSDATEYEVVDDGTELALTLVRAVGSMSVNLHPLRDEPAASEIPVPGAQELGEHVSTRLAVLPSAAGWHRARAVALAEEFRSSFLMARGSGMPSIMPAPVEGIAVEGEDVHVSSVRRAGEWVEIRVVAMCDRGAAARIRGSFARMRTVDLLGYPLDGATPEGVEVSGTLKIHLRPWEIRTIQVRSRAATSSHPSGVTR